MEKYKTIKKLGSGAFGHVQKAQNLQTKQIVAIKKLKKKYSTWDQCLQLAEVKALRKLTHPNIIKLKQVVRVTNDAYFVFEYIDRDLYKLCQQRKQKGKQLAESEIKYIAYQVAQALLYMHKQGFFHRDLKPENLLVSQENTVKLIDFGLAKQIRSKPPFTEYVSTRWYRAPEILLKSSSYSAPVDVFAFGCLLAEMYLMKPVFMGTSEIDQMNKICSLLGTPTPQEWNEGHKLANLKGYNFPQYSAIPLSSVFPNCSSEGLNLIAQCLRFDPSKRITISQVVNHPYFKDVKIDIKVKEEQNPFETIGNKLETNSELPRTNHSISEHEFDQLLNGFSSNKKQVKKEETAQYESKNSSKKIEQPLETFTYSLATKLEPDIDNSRYGGYMPSFSTTKEEKKKKNFGIFGLESIKR